MSLIVWKARCRPKLYLCVCILPGYCNPLNIKLLFIYMHLGLKALKCINKCKIPFFKARKVCFRSCYEIHQGNRHRNCLPNIQHGLTETSVFMVFKVMTY